MADEHIEVVAALKDELSAPAARAAKAIDKVGSEAAKTAVELEAMGAAADGAGDDLDQLSRKATKASIAEHRAAKGTAEHRAQVSKLGAVLHKTSVEVEGFDKKVGRTGTKSGGFFNRIEKFGKWAWGKKGLAIKWGLIATGASLAATGLKGLGAAGYAAVAGLTPLTGMIVAYPGLISAALQSFGVFKLATSGMGAALKVMLDPKSTAADIAKATAGMSKNQAGVTKTIAGLDGRWKSLKKTVSSKFFAGVSGEIKGLAKTYFPMLNKQLGATATSWNKVIKFTGKWMQSNRGKNSIQKNMATNAKLTETFGKGFSRLGLVMSGVLNAASPMLLRMGRDFNHFSKGLEDDTFNNQTKLRHFFNQSYSLAKKTGHVLGDFSKGLLNIGKQSDVMQKFLGHGAQNMGSDFKAWTEDKGNQAKVRKFFKDSIPIVKELGLWVRDLVKAGGTIAGSNSDFLSTSQTLRTKVLPEVAKFIHDIGHWTSGVIGNLDKSGALGGSLRAVKLFGKGIKGTAELLGKIPDNAAKALAFAGTVYGVYKIFSKFKTGNAILSGLSGGRLGKGGIQKVFVVNMGKGFGGGPGGPGGGTDVYPVGDPRNKPRKPGAHKPVVTTRGGRAGQGLKTVGKVLGATILGGLTARHLLRSTKGEGGHVGTRTRTPIAEKVPKVTVPKTKLGEHLGKTYNPKTSGGRGSALLAFLALNALTGLGGEKGRKFSESSTGKGAIYGSLLGPEGAIGGAGIGAAVSQVPKSKKYFGAVNSSDKKYASEAVGQKALYDRLQKSSIGKYADDLHINVGKLAKDMSQHGVAGKYTKAVQDKIKEPGLLHTNPLHALQFPSPEDKKSLARKSLGSIMDAQHSTSGVFSKPFALNQLGPTKGAAPKTPVMKAPVMAAPKKPSWLDSIVKGVSPKINPVMGPGAKSVAALAQDIGKIPKKKDTKVDAPGAVKSAGWIGDLNKKFHAMPPKKETKTSAPGAVTAGNQVGTLANKLKEVHSPKIVHVSVTGAAAAINAAASVGAALAKIHDKSANVSANPTAQFAGGQTHIGQLILAGEMGPEAHISRTGKMSILGKYGPELAVPGEGATIPASATANPWRGAAGNAPTWALDAYRNIAEGQHGTSGYGNAGRPGEGDSGALQPLPPLNVNFYGDVKSDVDVKQAVKSAYQEMIRLEKERR